MTANLNIYRGLPFLGALPELRRDMMGTFERIAKLGDVVRIRLPLRTGTLVAHPDGIKHVLVDNHKNYGKQTRGYQMLRLSLGQGLVTSEGDFWRRQRRIAQPAFHHQRIAAFGEVMTRATGEMLATWTPGATVEVHDAMMQVTLKIVGQCLLSTDLSDSSEAVGEAITTVLEGTVARVQNPLTLPLSWPTPSNLRYRRALSAMDEMVYRIIRERQASKEAQPQGAPPSVAHGSRELPLAQEGGKDGATAPSPRHPPDLLAMFMEARDEETGESMSERHLRDEVMTMVSAGHETTANALTWTFYLLSENPAAAQELYAEVDRVLGGRTPSFEDLPKLTYTEAVIKESMRVLPPVWMIARSATERDEILGTEIPEGSMVFLPAWIMHRDPRFWDRPKSFVPERWLEPEIEQMPKYAYFPFASGPRVCIGNSFAMMEAKLLLAMIVSRFALTLVPGHPVVPTPTVTLRPKHGMKMTLSSR